MKKNKKLSYEEISIFSREMAMVVNSDISMQEGLNLIKEQSNNKAMATLCDRLKDNINKGFTFKKCILLEEDVLTEYFVKMVTIGEDSGNIDIMLRRIADSYEKDTKISKKIKSAITYPVILSVLMLGVVILMVVKVIPLFNDILLSLGGEVNQFSSVIINVGIFIGDKIFIILGIIVGIYLIYKVCSSISKFDEFFDSLLLKIPFRKGIEKTYHAILISRNLSMLIKSGISVALAFDMIIPILNNSIMKKKVKKVSDSIKGDKDINEAFNELDMFPNIFIRMFQIANKTGHLDEVLQEASESMEEQLDYRLEKLTTVLEPALIILISLIVGVILISIIFPVIDIMNSIG